jgi:hypothetical protein
MDIPGPVSKTNPRKLAQKKRGPKKLFKKGMILLITKDIPASVSETTYR